MNIFFLDKNPTLAAEYQCDKHVVKMILETTQMVCTAYQARHGIKKDLYKPAFPHHPMTKWVGETYGNFNWALTHLVAFLSSQMHHSNLSLHNNQNFLP